MSLLPSNVEWEEFHSKLNFHSMCSTAECAIVEKKVIHQRRGMREESSEFLSSVVSFYRTYFKALWNRKKKRKKENGNLRNCTIKKMNGWNEDMIYGEFIHTFLCMLCLMSLYYSAVISSSALFFLIGFMSLKVIWWPIYCVLSEIQFWGGSSRY